MIDIDTCWHLAKKVSNQNTVSLYSKWTYCRSGINYRVASLITRYLTAKGMIPEV